MTFYSDTYTSLKVHLIPCRRDNYSYILEGANKETVIIDPSLKTSVVEFLRKQDLKPQALFLTHHHYDHVDGLAEIQKEFKIPIYCSEFDSRRKAFDGKHTFFKDGDKLHFLNQSFSVLKTAGHTKSHHSFFNKENNLLFCGDTLFSLGCGRVFEKYDGVFDDFFESMQKIKSLCDNKTKIYCAHEYTLQNLEFLFHEHLISLEGYKVLQKNLMRKPRTLPTSLEFELKHNPFLKAQNPEDFKVLRTRKDQF